LNNENRNNHKIKYKRANRENENKRERETDRQEDGAYLNKPATYKKPAGLSMSLSISLGVNSVSVPRGVAMIHMITPHKMNMAPTTLWKVKTSPNNNLANNKLNISSVVNTPASKLSGPYNKDIA
jgi:hypothetical protein